MSVKHSKYKVKRELKQEVSKQLLKRVVDYCSNYGYGKVLAEASCITYNTLADVIRTGKATPTCVKKITSGLKELKLEQAA